MGYGVCIEKRVPTGPDPWGEERGDADVGAGRPRKYKTGMALRREIDRYFGSITRTVTATERIPTGERDSKGHEIYRIQDIVNDLGEPIRYKEYVIPPSIGGLCLFLGISKQTWSEYCGIEEFIEPTTRARARVEAYLEEQLTTREKNVQGIVFNLQHNYGWKEKRDVTIHGSVESYLAQMDEAGEEQTL